MSLLPPPTPWLTSAASDVQGSAIQVMDAEDALGVGRGLDILVVDDHPTNLIAYEAALAPLGRNVVLAQSGVDALGTLLDHDVALILLDVSMPGMSGLDMARLVRERPRSKGTPIIFITGSATDNALVVEAYELGAFDFVIKPILPEVLRAKVRVYLQLQERTHTLLRQARELREAQKLVRETESAARDAVEVSARLERLHQATAALEHGANPVDVAAVAVRLAAEALGTAAAVTFTDHERGFLAALAATCEQAVERARVNTVEAEARLKRRNDEFLAMLGHELRNPLAVMTSAIHLLQLRDASPNRELSILDRNTAHLARIVDDLVDLSRITQGKIELRREAVCLADAVAAALDVTALISRRAHQVSVSVDTALLLDADQHRLAQVLENLLSNAAKCTPDGGQIWVAAEREPDGPFVRITVTDNGRGIPSALLPRVFDAFVQGQQASDRSDGGLGIGLTLARHLVELHGGQIEAHSDGPGAGSTFTLRWPACSPTHPLGGRT